MVHDKHVSLDETEPVDRKIIKKKKVAVDFTAQFLTCQFSCLCSVAPVSSSDSGTGVIVSIDFIYL